MRPLFPVSVPDRKCYMMKTMHEPVMNVVVEEMPALRIAAVPHVGPYDRISEAFRRLAAIAGPAGLLRNGAMMVAVYHDNPQTTPPAQLRSDAGVVVSDDVHLPTELAERRLPAGRHARTTHIGPYATLADAWSRMMSECTSGRGIRIAAGPCYEIYRNDPSSTRPEELRTDLYVPVA
jgi:AraC family transcriptional regulator